MAELNVTGLAELQKFIETFAPKLQRTIMRTGMRAGANVLRKIAVGIAPSGPPSAEGKRLYGGHVGALKQSIRVGTKFRRGVVTGSVTAGGKIKTGADVFYAFIIEYGGVKQRTPYRIPSRTSQVKRLFFGGGWRGHVMHPPIKAQPFMRPALQAGGSAAVIAAGRAIKRRLSRKENLDVAYIASRGTNERCCCSPIPLGQ